VQGGPLPDNTFHYKINPPSLPELDLDGTFGDSDFEISSVHATSPDDESLELGSDANEESSSSPFVSNDDQISVACETPVAVPIKSAVPGRKIKIESSMHLALGSSNKAPLLNYFKQCTHKEYLANLARDWAAIEDKAEDLDAMDKAAKQQSLLHK
jgi:hypothetical protein